MMYMRKERHRHFNSRPRMRANLTGALDSTQAQLFQLPPSHEGERREAADVRLQSIISTPALA